MLPFHYCQLHLCSISLPEKENENENQNTSTDAQCNGPSLGNKISPKTDMKPARPPPTQQGNLFPNNEVRKDLQIKQVDKMGMMDQLAQELGNYG